MGRDAEAIARVRARGHHPVGRAGVGHRRRAAARDALFARGVPVLGICYGMQTMAAQLGGRVAPAAHREFGYAEVRAHGIALRVLGPRSLTARPARRVDEPRRSRRRLPPGFTAIALDDELRRSPRWRTTSAASTALQFHPEVTHTKHGHAILAASCATSAAAPALDAEEHRRRAHRAIRAKVGNDRVLLGLSGGVDSSVVAALLHRRSATSSPACSSTRACCASTKATRSWRLFAKHLGSA